MEREFDWATIVFKRQVRIRNISNDTSLLIANKPAVVVFRSVRGACTILLADIDSWKRWLLAIPPREQRCFAFSFFLFLPIRFHRLSLACCNLSALTMEHDRRLPLRTMKIDFLFCLVTAYLFSLLFQLRLARLVNRGRIDYLQVELIDCSVFLWRGSGISLSW